MSLAYARRSARRPSGSGGQPDLAALRGPLPLFRTRHYALLEDAASIVD